MGTPRYTEEFEVEAVRQVLDRGHRVSEVAQRLGVSPYSLYQWIKRWRLADHAARCGAAGIRTA
jgi:transposase